VGDLQEVKDATTSRSRRYSTQGSQASPAGQGYGDKKKKETYTVVEVPTRRISDNQGDSWENGSCKRAPILLREVTRYER